MNREHFPIDNALEDFFCCQATPDMRRTRARKLFSSALYELPCGVCRRRVRAARASADAKLCQTSAGTGNRDCCYRLATAASTVMAASPVRAAVARTAALPR